ncbi:hypothetical protein Hanom_Chr14g01282341 [Helianthus anomalus]
MISLICSKLQALAGPRTIAHRAWRTPKALSTSFLADSCCFVYSFILSPWGYVKLFTNVAHSGYIPSAR